MSAGNANMKSYWDERFAGEGYVWGDSPSKTAVYALGLFRSHHVCKILVPGSGYGRNSRLFSMSGFDVTGIEISEVAWKMAQEFDPLTKHHNGSVLDMSLGGTTYDAIFCFNTVHLFYKEERRLFLRECAGKLRDGGLMFFVVFSESEPSYGKGKQVEDNTFESRPGRPAHYFAEDDLLAHFSDFEILESGVLEDPEDHGEGPHTHVLRYVFARKPPGTELL